MINWLNKKLTGAVVAIMIANATFWSGNASRNLKYINEFEFFFLHWLKSENKLARNHFIVWKRKTIECLCSHKAALSLYSGKFGQIKLRYSRNIIRNHLVLCLCMCAAECMKEVVCRIHSFQQFLKIGKKYFFSKCNWVESDLVIYFGRGKTLSYIIVFVSWNIATSQNKTKTIINSLS